MRKAVAFNVLPLCGLVYFKSPMQLQGYVLMLIGEVDNGLIYQR